MDANQTEHRKGYHNNMRALAEHPSVIVFRVGQNYCAVSVEEIDSVVVPQPLTFLPHQPPWAKGIFQFRGHPIGVISLFYKFGIDEPNTPEQGSYLVVMGSTGLTAFWVDEVYDITTNYKSHDTLPAGVGKDTIFQNVLEWDSKIVLLCDVKRIIAMEDEITDGDIPDTSNIVLDKTTEQPTDKTTTLEVKQKSENNVTADSIIEHAPEARNIDTISDDKATAALDEIAEKEVSERVIADLSTNEGDVANDSPSQGEHIVQDNNSLADESVSQETPAENAESNSGDEIRSEINEFPNVQDAPKTTELPQDQSESDSLSINETSVSENIQSDTDDHRIITPSEFIVKDETASVEVNSDVATSQNHEGGIDNNRDDEGDGNTVISSPNESIDINFVDDSNTSFVHKSVDFEKVSTPEIENSPANKLNRDEIATNESAIRDRYRLNAMKQGESSENNSKNKLLFFAIGTIALLLVLALGFALFKTPDTKKNLESVATSKAIDETAAPVIKEAAIEEPKDSLQSANSNVVESKVQRNSNDKEILEKSTKEIETARVGERVVPPIASKSKASGSDTIVSTKTKSSREKNKVVNNGEKKAKRTTHSVQKGDTLWSISGQYLNDPFRFEEIAEANKKKNPDLIYPQEKLKIPK